MIKATTYAGVERVTILTNDKVMQIALLSIYKTDYWYKQPA